jgi:hypothetical protein
MFIVSRFEGKFFSPAHISRKGPKKKNKERNGGMQKRKQKTYELFISDFLSLP